MLVNCQPYVMIICTLQALLEIQIEVYHIGNSSMKHERDVGISKLRQAPHEIRAEAVACLRSGGAHGQYLDTDDFHTILEVLLALVEFEML